nr:hypothetical protein Iba_chr06fCG0720 [Ipomoea batatas]
MESSTLLPVEGCVELPMFLSEVGDFCHGNDLKLSNGLPSSDGHTVSTVVPDLNSNLSLPPTPSEDQFTDVSSPATRPRLSHRKLHDGEYLTFRCKISLAAPFDMVLSLAATQHAEPMLAHIQTGYAH